MERTALGFCGLSAREFDRMTPREVQWRIDADVEKENRAFERLAQLACWVMNPWIKSQQDRYSVRKLLKRRPKQTDWDAWERD